jgi:hypothetical protein
MKTSYFVKPRLVVAVVQLIVIGLFAVSVYSYLHTVRKRNSYEEKLRTVQIRQSQIVSTEQRLAAYRKYVTGQPRLSGLPEKLKWEEVNLSWKNIAFTELLHRLNNIYTDERVFVLQSFSFAPDVGATGVAGADFASRGADRNGSSENQQFELKGYYLCLHCQ